MRQEGKAVKFDRLNEGKAGLFELSASDKAGKLRPQSTS